MYQYEDFFYNRIFWIKKRQFNLKNFKEGLNQIFERYILKNILILDQRLIFSNNLFKYLPINRKHLTCSNTSGL